MYSPTHYTTTKDAMWFKKLYHLQRSFLWPFAVSFSSRLEMKATKTFSLKLGGGGGGCFNPCTLFAERVHAENNQNANKVITGG